MRKSAIKARNYAMSLPMLATALPKTAKPLGASGMRRSAIAR